MNKRIFAILGIAGFLVGTALWMGVSGAAGSKSSTAPMNSGNRDDEAQTIDDRVDFELPSQELTPRDVVVLQLESLQESVEDPDRLTTCYSFASPANRSQTGPFDRFAAMFEIPPYAWLAESKDYLVGDAEVFENEAVVLVSSRISGDSQQPVIAFRFFLIKQTEPPYEGCWMTEAVQTLALQRQTDPQPREKFNAPKRENPFEP